MAPEPRRAPPTALSAALPLAALSFAASLFAAPPAAALRLMDYNVTDYPNVLFPQRQPYFRTILAPLHPDLLTCEEFTSQAGVDSFLTNVLNVVEPGQWAAAPFVNGNDTDGILFYKPARVQLLGAWTFYPNPLTNLRLVDVYRVKPVDVASGAGEIRLYVVHLKASSGSTNVTARYNEAIGIRDSMNAAPPGTQMVLCGDFNIYTSTEAAWGRFLESEANNTGQLVDALNAVGAWNNNAAFETIHTQCPCLTCPTGSGFSGGGLDDRFDILLPTANLLDGHGMDFIVPTYVPVGNDGLHFNLNITDAPTIPEGAAYATALWNASDHLPVRVDLMLPARASAPASLALGAAITGAVVGVPLAVANAAAPLDSLETLAYTITPDPGFTAPPGPETLREGEVAADAIGMDTGAPGVRSGSLFIATNDPDHPVLQVAVAGTVLRHAQASLDSAAAVTQATLDFGTHAAGGFSPLAVRVHDRGYDALQARLQLATAAIAGGAGRFSLAPGGVPALIAGTGQTFPVAFDDAGATPDSTYTATLTFTGADEALPGAAPQPDLHVTLAAHPAGGGTTAATDAPPAATLLYAPAPNPLAGAGLVRFDLARAGAVTLDVFDPSGRRVASIVHRDLGPGRYTFRWDGRTDAGRPLGAGLYFVRLTAPGSGAQTVRLALVR